MHGTFEPERQIESNDGEMSGEQLGNLLRQVSKTSVGEIDGLVGELGPVLRREGLDISFAILVHFAKGVFRALGREQVARLGKRDPSPLALWPCRQ